MKYKRMLSVLLLFICIFLLAFMLRAYFDGQFDSVESLQEYVSSFGAFAPAMLTFIQAAQVVLPILPGFLGCAVGAVLFGTGVGFVCNYIGISAGSIAAFFLAKKFGTKLVVSLFPHEKYDKYAKWAATSRSYTALLFIIMVLPLFPDDFFCYFSGLTKMTMKKFAFIIILGKPWCILAYSIIFGHLGGVW